MAGILAHEFGHFSQGFGMRLTYIIQSINFWFVRVAYERDQWDVTLQEWAEETEDWRVMIVTNVARVAVWLSRLLLKGLLYSGHAIGCFMLRQMEYNADACQIRLAGSPTFESTALRLHVLGAALGQAYKQIRMTWHVGKRLPDNFPAYLIQHANSLPPDARQRLEDTAGLGTTGMFDTHPTAGDRIRQARRAAEPGIFKMDAPASALFSNYQVLAKQVTLLHYSDDLGIPLMMANLQPVEPGQGQNTIGAPATAP
jgi:Zn-dependent protease with chaperone function